jgi:hypothetical protein
VLSKAGVCLLDDTAQEGTKMTVEAPLPAAATAVNVNTPALAAKDRAPATIPSPFNYAKKVTPPPATPEPRRAVAKPDGAKLQRDAEEAVKHYGHDKVEYQSKLRQLEASSDTPQRQDQATSAYLLVAQSWKNAQRAATAYLEFVKSEDNFRELDDATAKIQLDQLKKNPPSSNAAIVMARAEAACKRAAIAYAHSSERVKSAQKLLDFANSFPDHPDPLPSLKPSQSR